MREMAGGTIFKPVISEANSQPERVRRIVLCSGKIFYALDAERRRAGGLDEIQPVRIEQLYPFPASELRRAIAPFSRAEIVWFQEEAENQGAWRYVEAELEKAGIRLSSSTPVISRPAMSVCAGGSIERHEREEREILARVIDLQAIAV